MKNILLSLTVAVLLVGCGSKQKKPENVGTETTASGSTEKVDTTAMSFAAAGSDSGQIEGLQTVHFEYDKASLTEGEQKKLEGNAAWMAKNAGVKLVVEGHCDQKGSTEYNLSLGERRANAVKQMLVKLGVKGDRVTTVSYGKEKPLANGDSAEEMAQNRRANFAPAK